MSRFGLGYPENYAKCREIAVYDYGTYLVSFFANVILVRNNPGKFFARKTAQRYTYTLGVQTKE